MIGQFKVCERTISNPDLNSLRFNWRPFKLEILEMSCYSGERNVPLTVKTALRPADNDDQLIKPKPIPNPVLSSGLHSALNKEIKIKSKGGNLRNDKSELEKIFHERKIKSNQREIPDERKPIDIELGQKLFGNK